MPRPEPTGRPHEIRITVTGDPTLSGSYIAVDRPAVHCTLLELFNLGKIEYAQKDPGPRNAARGPVTPRFVWRSWEAQRCVGRYRPADGADFNGASPLP